jgi:hypothetical protein
MDIKKSDSDDAARAAPTRKRGRPRAPPGSKADTPRNAQRRLRAQQRKTEDTLEKEWRAAVAAKDNKSASILYQKLLPTVRGRQLFPVVAKKLSTLKSMEGFGKNFKQMQKGLGVRSKHRKDIASSVTRDLPAQFCTKVLGFKPTYLRKARQRESKGRQRASIESTAPALITEGRDETKGRKCWKDDFKAVLATFFRSRAEILSGANTHTRRLLMTKIRLEIEFEAQYPAMLRKLSELDPDIRPDNKSKKYLTTLQKNVLAAEFVAEDADFSESEEYNSRLQAALQRSAYRSC